MVLASVIRLSTRANRTYLVSQCCARATYSTDNKGKYFTKKHEWVSVHDNVGTVGISNYAQVFIIEKDVDLFVPLDGLSDAAKTKDALGEVVFAQLPTVGREVSAGEECGALESVKAASEIFSPVTGTITAKNDDVEKTPSLINKSCFGEGWLFKVKLAKPEEIKKLMNQEQYETYLEESH